MKKIAQDFEQKAEQLFVFTNHDTEEYNRFAKILGYAWNAQLDWMCKDSKLTKESIELAEKVIKRLERFEDDLMRIYPDLFACLKHTILYDKSLKSVDSLTKIKSFQLKALENPKLPEALNGSQLFEISADEQSSEFIQYQETHNVNEVLKVNEVLAAATKSAQENAIGNQNWKIQDRKRILDMLETASKKMKANDLMEKIEAIFIFIELSDICLDSLQLKQTLHILSVAMHHLMRICQCLSMDEKENLNVYLNEVQTDLCFRFARYGDLFILGSLETVWKGEEHIFFVNGSQWCLY